MADRNSGPGCLAIAGIGLLILLAQLAKKDIPYFLEKGSPKIESGQQGCTITGSEVNVRNGPGEISTKIAYVKRGDVVIVLYVEGSWVRVMNAIGETGYIFKKYVNIFENLDYWLKSGPPVFKPGQYGGAIIRNRVYVRAEPGDNYRKIGYVERGDQVVVLNKPDYVYFGPLDGNPKGWWVEVQNTDGEIGYIADSFVKRFEMPVPHFLEYGQPIIEPGQLGGIIRRKMAYVRSEPDAEASKIAYANLSDTVIVMKSEGQWTEVMNAKSETGYIALDLIKLYERPRDRFAFSLDELTKSRCVGFVGISVDVRKGPSIRHELIDSVGPRAYLRVKDFNDIEDGFIDEIGNKDRWLKVYSVYESVGYVLEKYVEQFFDIPQRVPKVSS